MSASPSQHKRSEKIRVLHLVTNLEHGGIEKLVHDLALRIDKTMFELDICCVGGTSGPLLDSVRDAGVKVFSFGHYRKNPLHFFSEYHDLLKRKSYHVVHSHLNHFSWIFLRYPYRNADVPLRIVHYHSIFSNPLGREGAMSFKQMLRKISRWITDRYANCILGISDASLDAVYGVDQWRSNSKVKRLYNGVPLKDLCVYPGKRYQGRYELGISPTAFVLGHVGRFRPEKNQKFLVTLAAQLCRDVPECVFVLVGDGPLLEEVKLQVKSSGLENHFIFTGARKDVKDLLQIMDLFVFPSLWEGFGLSSLEAQAAGLPVLASDNVPGETPIIPPSMRLPLNNVQAWEAGCKKIMESNLGRKKLIAVMQRRLESFSIEKWVSEIEGIYKHENMIKQNV